MAANKCNIQELLVITLKKIVKERSDLDWNQVHNDIFNDPKCLPRELRNTILKELIKERADLGWDKVHDELYNTPYCKKKRSKTQKWLLAANVPMEIA